MGGESTTCGRTLLSLTMKMLAMVVSTQGTCCQTTLLRLVEHRSVAMYNKHLIYYNTGMSAWDYQYNKLLGLVHVYYTCKVSLLAVK